MMYPSLRGGNKNPGVHESFYGEVNDILSALDYLEKQDYVDPKRVYLGGQEEGLNSGSQFQKATPDIEDFINKLNKQ